MNWDKRREIAERLKALSIDKKFRPLIVRAYLRYTGDLDFNAWAKMVVEENTSIYGVGPVYRPIVIDILRKFNSAGTHNPACDWMEFEYSI